MVYCESANEFFYALFLEIDTEVISYQEQPFTLRFTFEGKKHKYTPDFLVTRKDRTEVIEVKEADEIAGEEYQLLFRLVAPLVAEKGYKFIVVEAEEVKLLPRLENVRLLWRYARVPIDPQHQIAVREIFSDRNSIPLSELQQLLAERSVSPQVMYALLYWGLLAVDLTCPLDDQASISLPGVSPTQGGR
jgi:hypothetical protein